MSRSRALAPARVPFCGGLALLIAAGPLAAQSGVVQGTGEDLLQLLDNNGKVAVVFDVDDVNTTQTVRFGRADLQGFDESNVDIELIDEDSTLAVDDRSIFLDSSGANITLGSGSVTEPGSDGDLFLEDGLGTTNILIDGATGNFTQNIDNTGPAFNDYEGNGALKAWAVINFDGTVARCWKCSGSGANTQRLATGDYEVDFLLGDVGNRPVSVDVTCVGPANLPIPGLPTTQCVQPASFISVAPRLSDASSFFVAIRDSSGSPANRSFTLLVY